MNSKLIMHSLFDSVGVSGMHRLSHNIGGSPIMVCGLLYMKSS